MQEEKSLFRLGGPRRVRGQARAGKQPKEDRQRRQHRPGHVSAAPSRQPADKPGKQPTSYPTSQSTRQPTSGTLPPASCLPPPPPKLQPPTLPALQAPPPPR